MKALNLLRTTALAWVLLFSTTGCFTIDMLIKVRPDGSGEIEMTSAIKKDFVQSFASFAGEEGASTVEDIFSEESLKEQAAELGPGVKLVRHEVIREGDMEGVRAYYTFENIGTLRPEMMGGTPGSDDGDDQNIDFTFEKGTGGAPSVITALLPTSGLEEGGGESGEVTKAEDAEPAAEQSEEAAAEQAMQMAMMSQLFAGLKIQVAMQVEGKLISSNAPRVEGNRMTLLAVDFNEMLKAPEKLQALFENEPSSFADLQKMTADIPGLIFPAEPELRIEFTEK